MDGWWMEWSKTYIQNYIQNHWRDFNPIFFKSTKHDFKLNIMLDLILVGSGGRGWKKNTPQSYV